MLKIRIHVSDPDPQFTFADPVPYLSHNEICKQKLSYEKKRQIGYKETDGV